MKALTLPLLLLIIGLCSPLWGQKDAKTEDAGSLYLKRTSEPITLDGKLDEAAWYTGEPASDFWLQFPNDSSRAQEPTEIYMTYDDQFLYIGARCTSVGDDYIVPSLRRDYGAGGSDNLTFLIDPFNDRTNAFVFGMNPAGVMREALVFNGGQNGGRDWDSGWDNKWKGESYIGDGYWSCELAIPFKTLRFKEGATEWNFNSYRFDTQGNTRQTWQRIPQNQSITNLAFMGKMTWDEPLKKPGANISFIPYVSGSYLKDFEGGTKGETGSDIGADAKIGVTSSLNLDLTVNPDFSQVEVDQQVINLDRFEIQFPERRQFFLENADLFAGFGEQRLTPFFSRRIGIDQDTAGNTVGIPILYGARLSGKLDRNWRLGVLNTQTREEASLGVPNVNYSVLAMQRKVFSRSNVGFIFVNKEAFSNREGLDISSPYNRVAGVDYNLASSDNRWNGKLFYHQAFTTDDSMEWWEKFAHGARLEYRVRDFSLSWAHQWVRDGYDPEVGFVRRTDIFQVSPRFSWFWYPNTEKVAQKTLSFQPFVLWKPGTGKADHEYSVNMEWSYQNTSNFEVEVRNLYTFLLDEFDPTRTDSEPLPANTGYNYSDIRLSYRSNQREVISYRISPRFGQYFNGYRFEVSANVQWRYQPFGSIELNARYAHINLPDPYATADLFLIGPRIDFTFSKSLFFTTFLQYNSQFENFNLNSRLQWRFAPVSDFFLVYTDNYDTTSFGVKNRSLVAKVTYWLNL